MRGQQRETKRENAKITISTCKFLDRGVSVTDPRPAAHVSVRLRNPPSAPARRRLRTSAWWERKTLWARVARQHAAYFLLVLLQDDRHRATSVSRSLRTETPGARYADAVKSTDLDRNSKSDDGGNQNCQLGNLDVQKASQPDQRQKFKQDARNRERSRKGFVHAPDSTAPDCRTAGEKVRAGRAGRASDCSQRAARDRRVTSSRIGLAPYVREDVHQFGTARVDHFQRFWQIGIGCQNHDCLAEFQLVFSISPPLVPSVLNARLPHSAMPGSARRFPYR